jgi:hypothetical protein
VFIEPADLSPFVEVEITKAMAMIEDAEALALAAAPCLNPDPPAALTAGQKATVKAILRGAILRWNEAGTGAMQSQTAGPFAVQVDTRQVRRGMFLASEIDQLQKVCGSAAVGAFSIDTVSATTTHQAWCSWMLGAVYCSCGADLAGYPLWEAGTGLDPAW